MRKQSQRDPKWKNKKLGFSSSTLGGFGCLVSSLANMFDIRPDEMNDWLKEHNGFSNSKGEIGGSGANLLVWSAVPGYVTRKKPYDNNAVKEAISKYGGVIVQVDWDGNPSTIGDHYVVYIGNHRMIDPWDGKEKPTSAYSVVKGYAVYDIEKAKTYFHQQEGDYYKGIDLNNKESVKVCVDTWADVRDGKYVKKEQYEEVQNAILQLEKEKSEMNGRLKELTKQLDECKKGLGEKTSEIKSLEKELERVKKAFKDEVDSQVDFGDRAAKEEAKRKDVENEFSNFLSQLEDKLKLGKSNDSRSTRKDYVLHAVDLLVKKNNCKDLEAQFAELVSKYDELVKENEKLRTKAQRKRRKLSNEPLSDLLRAVWDKMTHSRA